MGALDDLRAGGFSEDEVSSFAAEKRQALLDGGFSERETNDYLGVKPEPNTSKANGSLARTVGDALWKAWDATKGAAEKATNPDTYAPSVQTVKDASTIYGPIEAVLNAGTGILLGFPAYLTGAMAGLSNKYLMNGQADPAQVAETMQSIFTYKPLSEPGRRLAGNLLYPLHLLAEGAEAAGHKVTDTAMRWNLPENIQAAAGATTDATIQMLGPVLLGSLVKRMTGTPVTREEVSSAALEVAGPKAEPEVVKALETALHETYEKTGIDPATVAAVAETNQKVKADLLAGKDEALTQHVQEEIKAEMMAYPGDKTMYHGTRTGEAELQPSKQRGAVYLTPDENVAKDYADQAPGEGEPHVRAFNVSTEQTFRSELPQGRGALAEFVGKHPREFDHLSDTFELLERKDVQKWLKDQGYDSYTVRESEGNISLAVFDPKRLKATEGAKEAAGAEAKAREPEPWEEAPEPALDKPEDYGLEHPAVREILANMAEHEAGWLQEGGKLDRGRLVEANRLDQGGLAGPAEKDLTKLGKPAFTTWIPRAEWWKGRPDKLNEAQVKQAITKALAGERLSPKELRTVDYMTEIAADRARAVEQMGHDEWTLAAEAAHEHGLEPTTPNVQDVDAVARAAAFDQAAVERAALQHDTDDAAFMAEIRRINAEGEEQNRAAAGSGNSRSAGEGGAAQGPVAEQRPFGTLAEPAGERAGGARAADGAAAGERVAGEEVHPAEQPAAEVLKRYQAKKPAPLTPAEQLRATREADPYQGVVNLNIGLTPGDLAKTAGAIGDAARAVLERAKETKVGAAAADWTKEVVNDLQVKATPMSAGSDRARAIAKDFANADRLARYQWARFDKILKDSYTKEEREAMWNAAEEENVLRTMGVPEAERGGRGLEKLTPEQRETMETLQDYGNKLLQRAKDVGLFKGEGVEYWAPRMVAIIGEDGEVTVPKREPGVDPSPFTSPQGGNITTSASSLKHRKHLTVEQTEEAAKEAFGEEATVVRDIRTMPLAMSRIERAIAGRELINGIKELGKKTAQDLISESDAPGYFTVDHPSFKTYRPRFTEGEDGKIVAERDAEGKPILDRVPLYVSKEFEGPLKAIMSDKPGKIYNAFMALKGKTMGVIMYSPLIHNAVEWGRALPAMPGKVLTFRVYFEGNEFKNDPASMTRAIDNGLVPIGKWFNFQDISGIVQGDQIAPGRSLTAKALGGTVGLVNRAAGEALKHGIDTAGDFWHNTLLWDRVGDLQAGIYKNVEADLITKGVDEKTSGRIAAHFANRFAGALPNEAMSASARKAANFFFFSRTFKFGNLGVMKDMLTGLPGDVAAQIHRDAGEAAAFAAKGISQRKAIEAFALDIALMYAANSALQSGLDYLKRNYSIGTIAHEYATRFAEVAKKVHESPMELLNPIGLLDHMSPLAENEPGKERRIFYDYDNQGTGIYVRLPTGKIGEEFLDWSTSPLQILQRSEGTLARPLIQTLVNDKGFGHQIYDAEAPGFKGASRAVGNVLWNIVSQQFPTDSLTSAVRLAKGYGDNVDAYKVIGPLFGVTFSRGAPGGPEVGEVYRAERRHRQEVAEAMPEVKELLKAGEEEKAIQKMTAAGMTPSEMKVTMRFAAEPGSRLSKSALRRFMQASLPEERERLEKQRLLRGERGGGAASEGDTE